MTTIATPDPTTRIVKLEQTHIPETARLFAQAFEHYPLMRYIFADQGAAYHQTLERLFHFTCERRLLCEGPMLGNQQGTRLVGAAAITEYDHPPWPAALEAMGEQFMASIGSRAASLMEHYGELAEQHRPPVPHLYLGVLGVHPGARRKGYARALLTAVHALAEANSTIQGVYLDTELATNVPLYEHFGYTIIGEEQLGPVSIWCMYRPNQRYS